MEYMTIAAIIVTSFFTGIFSLLLYILLRMMSNDGWDDSNITNALRVLSHVTLHAEDFGKMFYLNPTQVKILQETSTYQDNPLKRPFWYVNEDEFEGVVKTRP